MLNEALKTFIQVVCVPAFISAIISAAADESPGDDVFPCWSTLFINFPSKNVQK